MSFAFLTADPAAAGGMMTSMISLVLIVVVFYFFIMRPQQKQTKEANKMRSSLEVGDDIITIGGIVGTICAVKEDTIVLETSADRVRVEFTKWAISTKGTQATENAPADTKEKDSKK